MIVKKIPMQTMTDARAGRSIKHGSGAAYPVRHRRREHRLPDPFRDMTGPQMDVLLVAVKKDKILELHERAVVGGEIAGDRGHRRLRAAELLRVQLRSGAEYDRRVAEPGRQRDEYQHRERHHAAVHSRRQRRRTTSTRTPCRRNSISASTTQKR